MPNYKNLALLIINKNCAAYRKGKHEMFVSVDALQVVSPPNLIQSYTRKGGNRERRGRESEGWTGGTRKDYRTSTAAL